MMIKNLSGIIEHARMPLPEIAEICGVETIEKIGYKLELYKLLDHHIVYNEEQRYYGIYPIENGECVIDLEHTTPGEIFTNQYQ
ncbi:hypothetical protein AB1K32_15300 [Metabacillus dongyingensis]|uniref:hypothetical protein n=1 Tax=Metabacillus dongyingensis TaxID=2874282 RepID=UPI003B8B03C6